MIIRNINIKNINVKIILQNNKEVISIYKYFRIYPSSSVSNVLFFNVDKVFVYPKYKLLRSNNRLLSISCDKSVNLRFLFQNLIKYFPTVFDKNVIKNYNDKIMLSKFKEEIKDCLLLFYNKIEILSFGNKYFINYNISEDEEEELMDDNILYF